MRFGQSSRYFVADLTPEARPALQALRPRYVFLAESPHRDEIRPEIPADRRPLCGKAGREWWAMLGELLEGDPSEEVSLQRMQALCLKHRFAVANAVQLPLDPKIVASFPEADPLKTLGFAKMPGEQSFKAAYRKGTLAPALGSLSERLHHPALSQAKLICLGNDALWFSERALGRDEAQARILAKIAHPSAWWRKGGAFRVEARSRLTELFR